MFIYSAEIRFLDIMISTWNGGNGKDDWMAAPVKKADYIRALITSDSSKVPKACPDCRSESFVRYGKTPKGTPRYICKSCKRTFSNGGTLSKSQISEDVWMTYADCYVRRLTADDASQICGVSRATIYRMRAKIDTLQVQDEFVRRDGNVTDI